MRSCKVSSLVLFLAVCSISLVSAQGVQVVLQEPEIEPPVNYTERKLTEFRERLAELKGERSKLETEPFDASTTLNDLLTDLEASLKTLELSVDADPTFFDGPVGPVQIEGLGELNDTDKIFITDASLRFKTPFGSPDLVAADEATSVAFNLPYALSTDFFANITILRPRKQKVCFEFSKGKAAANGTRPCIREVEVFDQFKATVNPLLILDKIDGEISFDGFDGDPNASKINAVKGGQVSVIFKYAKGLELEVERSKESIREYITGGKAGPIEEFVATTNAVKFDAFGLPNYDLEYFEGGVPGFNHFIGVIKDDPYGELRMGDGARPDFPRPVAAYYDGDSGAKYDGLDIFRGQGSAAFRARATVGVRLKNFGPVDDSLTIPDHAAPGESEVEWTLNDAFTVNHTITLTKVSVSIDGPTDLENDSVKLFPGREYLLRIVFDGPLTLDQLKQYNYFWSEETDWLDDEEYQTSGDNQVTVTRKFTIKPDVAPASLVSFETEEGEAFSYESNFKLKPVAVSGMTHKLERVLPTTGETITLSDNTAVDTFFPSADPKASSRFTVTVNFTDHKGGDVDGEAINKELIQAHSRAQLIGDAADSSDRKVPETLPKTMLAAANTNHAIRVQINNEEALARFLVLPKVGATQITSKLTPISSGSILRTLTGSEDVLEAEPVTVTSNAMRLIRSDDGYELIVNGPADMNQYEAIWTVQNGGGPKTGFKRKDETGFSTDFRTGNILEQVEIVLKSDPSITVARMLGLQATLPPEIVILPFRTVAVEVSESALADGDAQKSLNNLIDNLGGNNQRLVELADEMEVAAAIKGAPDEILGETVCVWSIVDGSTALKINERVTRLQRDPSLGDFCFNLVGNIKQGFSPKAELRVELQVL